MLLSITNFFAESHDFIFTMVSKSEKSPWSTRSGLHLATSAPWWTPEYFFIFTDQRQRVRFRVLTLAPNTHPTPAPQKQLKFEFFERREMEIFNIY